LFRICIRDWFEFAFLGSFDSLQAFVLLQLDNGKACCFVVQGYSERYEIIPGIAIRCFLHTQGLSDEMGYASLITTNPFDN